MPTKVNAPLFVNVEEGKTYAWCGCGLSQNAPLCDGSHKTTDKEPFHFVADATKMTFLCGCAASQNPPRCDGSHCHQD
jgi:CDGSH-type Zn-finger protein